MQKSLRIGFFIVLVLLVQSGMISAQGIGIEPVGRMYNYWRPANDVAVQGNYTYVATGESGLQILDISDRTNPQLSGHIENPLGYARRVAVQGDLAAVYGNNVELFDVSNRSQPIFASTLDSLMDIQSVQLGDGRAYVMSETFYPEYPTGFIIFDTSDPAHPSRIANWNEQGVVYGPFAVKDTCAYILQIKSHRFEMMVLDLSDPDSLTSIAAISDPDPDYEFRDLFLQDQTIYIVSYSFPGFSIRTKIVVVDVSQPAQPVVRGICQLQDVFEDITANLVADNSHAYYFLYRYDQEISSLTTIDASDPANPTVSGTMEIPIHPDGFAVKNETMYCASGYDQFQVLSLHDPTQSATVGSYHTARARSVTVSNEKAYVCSDEDGLKIIDVSRPQNPAEIGSYQGAGEAKCLSVIDQIGFLSLDTAGVDILDLTDPTRPGRMAHIQTAGFARGTTIYGDYAFIADSSSDILIVDISDPHSPGIVGNYPFDANQIMIVEDTAYVAGADGFSILDIGDPENPDGICNFGINFTSVAIGWDRAYLTNNNRGLFILDIHDPSRPIYRNLIPYTGTINVELSGDYCLLSDKYGISVMLMTDPNSPVEVGQSATPGLVLGSAIVGNKIYVADWTNFGIYDCSEALGIVSQETLPITGFMLNAAFPNPFNSSTTITFSLPVTSSIRLSVHDLSGREIETLESGNTLAGVHNAVWDANGVGSGLYFVKLEAGVKTFTQKVMLVK